MKKKLQAGGPRLLVDQRVGHSREESQEREKNDDDEAPIHKSSFPHGYLQLPRLFGAVPY
ncbi:MAG TPA: hypothetical protein VKD72_39730 [Gemmataceae bacterium]|nr:hypothetical protein [Gemmataceae bacterium]